MSSIAFGDTVRIRTTVETERLGLAGSMGICYGFTTPSVTDIHAIGSTGVDRALSVKVEGHNDPLWLDPDLVEPVHCTPGLNVAVGRRSYTRGADGEWIEGASTSDD
jgi:hypothetical protein